VRLLIRLRSQEVHFGGITPHPTEGWIEQVARNVTIAEGRFLYGCRDMLHDQGTQFTSEFD
jgi:hypothetical protein